MLIFGHFCLGAYTGDSEGEAECVDLERLEDDTVEDGTAGYGL